MAVAGLMSSSVVSKAWHAPVAARPARSCSIGPTWSWSWTRYRRRSFQSRELTIANSIAKPPLVVVRAGEPPRAPRLVSAPTSSVTSRQALPSQVVNAPFKGYEKNMPGSLAVSDVVKTQPTRDAPEIYKDESNEGGEIKYLTEKIREMFRCVSDGEISMSAYDTAWVALVPALDGSDGPQFPKTLQWIIDSQFSDGSWGDFAYFSYFDRVCNTLACIVALKTWKTASSSVQRGINFIQKNLQAMATEQNAHMMIGFEIVFPALIHFAQKLQLDLPYDAPVIVTISAEGRKKLANIPMDIMHKVPTTLLHSLEGFHEEVDWDKLLKLQNEDGSFLSSPAATAACLLHTRDVKALGYLDRLLDRFNNAVPNVYPVDLFERMWIVDRLERLGIDRYFEKEIKDCLDYVYKYFTSYGIGWARGSPVQDLDDTAMGFRLLRKHGYDVNENVFLQFKGKHGDFVCFAGQSGQAVTGIFNFYRATQTRFPGEKLLPAGEQFAREFLADKLAANECYDKWIISKDLLGEVEYALRTPWHCSPPRLEVSEYLTQYGTNDIWIGKSLYRMPFVNNTTFLALAKADYNLSQAAHLRDLQKITRWNEDCRFGKLSFARQKYIEAVFSGASIFPEPELSPARLVWARNCVLTTVVDDYFDVGGTAPDLRRFVAAAREWDPSLMDGTAEEAKIVFNGLYKTINEIAQECAFAQGRDVGQHLKENWVRFLESILTEAELTAEAELTGSVVSQSFDEYMKTSPTSFALEPILLSTIFFLGEPVSDELVNDPKKLRLMYLVNNIGRLLNDTQGWKREKSQNKANAVSILLQENPEWKSEEEACVHIRAMVEEYMLELVREVHQPSHIPKSIRQAHFNMARVMQLYYQETDAWSNNVFMKEKVKKILFQPIL